MNIRRTKRVFSFFVLFVLYAMRINAQQTFNDSIKKEYPFVCTDFNKIENDSVGLSHFYAKLLQLETSNIPRVCIVHFGDSHIQADFFSGKVRQDLQLQFGNAGRGLVIPYHVARTNEPNSYQTSTNSKWQVRRNVVKNDTIPIGLSGVTIKSMDTSATLRIKVLDQPGLDYSFTKFTLFHDKSVNAFYFVVCDDENCVLGYINSSTPTGSNFASTEQLLKPMREIYFKNYQRDSILQKYSQVYGILLENGKPGLLYNTIGVNGAEFRHFNSSEYFNEQMAYLKPDLVIISMGTNEAYSTKFDNFKFYKQIDSLITSIKKLNPTADFLLTTPSDSYRKRKVKNPDMRIARATIQDYCHHHSLAYWDLYYIMGGYGSILDWFKKGLTAKDKLHFSRKGYELQGELLYRALQNGYLNYKQHTH